MKIIIIKYLELLILITFAIFQDIKYYKITNNLIVVFLIIGIITNFSLNGIPGILDSLIATLIPFIILFILFALKMLGSGDIKLFSAIGSIMGKEYISYLTIYSFLFGGVICLFIVLIKKNGAKRFKYLLEYLKYCFLTLKIHEYQDYSKKDSKNFRFSFAILGGIFLLFIINYYKGDIL